MDDSVGDQEISRNLSNRFRAFLSGNPRMTLREEGFAADLQGGTRYRFPFPGIHWASVVVLDHKGDFSRVPFGPRTWQSQLHFKQPQDEPVVVKAYTRCRAVVLTSAEDFPGDFEQSFPVGEDFPPPVVVVPLVFVDRGRVEYRGESDLYTVPGTIACYSARGKRGMDDLLSMVGLVREVISTDSTGLRVHGILSVSLGDHEITEFPGFVEGAIPFSGVIVLNAQEDHYWNIPY